MSRNELHAEPRTVTGKNVKRLRADGWIPAVLYGREVESRPLQIETKAAEEMVRQAGTSQLITIQVTGDKNPVQAVVRDLQRDVIRRELLHVDFYQVEMTTLMTVEVPLALIGESPVIEQGMGIMLQGLQTVEIECLPGDLIDAIEVDLSELTEVDQQVTVGDIAVPSTIRILSELEEMVVRISALEEVPEEEEEEELFEEITDVEPELVGREREEEEE